VLSLLANLKPQGKTDVAASITQIAAMLRHAPSRLPPRPARSGGVFPAKGPRRGREVVGRISAQVDAVGAPSGAFGFYEAIDDHDVARALLTAASEWLRARGVQKMVGPCNFRLEDPAPGFLTEGFEHRPTFMMAYSKPYYPAQMEEAGLQTVMDLHAYRGDKDHPLPSTLIERAAVADRIPQFQVREIQMDRLYAEAELLRALFNEGLKNNWGFVPFSSAHARKMAHDLRLLADPRIILIAEVAGRPVGAVINLPNFNQPRSPASIAFLSPGVETLAIAIHTAVRMIRGNAAVIHPAPPLAFGTSFRRLCRVGC